MLPRLGAMLRERVRHLAQLAESEPVRARDALRQALETDLITIRPAEAGRHVIAEFGLAPVQLAVGAVPGSAVARSGFGRFRQRVEIG